MRNAHRFGSLADNIARVGELIPAYNTSRFPTVLSREQQQHVIDSVNASSHPAVDRDAPSRWTQNGLDDVIRSADRHRRLAAAREKADTSASGSRSDSTVTTSLRKLLGGFKRTGASNTWVLSGNKTASGKPLLANDPHLDFTAPSIWSVMHVHSKESGYNVIGSSFPGVPGVRCLPS